MLTTEERSHRIALAVVSLSFISDEALEEACNTIFDPLFLSASLGSRATLEKAFRDSHYASKQAQLVLS